MPLNKSWINGEKWSIFLWIDKCRYIDTRYIKFSWYYKIWCRPWMNTWIECIDETICVVTMSGYIFKNSVYKSIISRVTWTYDMCWDFHCTIMRLLSGVFKIDVDMQMTSCLIQIVAWMYHCWSDIVDNFNEKPSYSYAVFEFLRVRLQIIQRP